MTDTTNTQTEMERRLPPERIEEILNARKERNGSLVAASDYDDLVLAYREAIKGREKMAAARDEAYEYAADIRTRADRLAEALREIQRETKKAADDYERTHETHNAIRGNAAAWNIAAAALAGEPGAEPPAQ